MSQGSPFLLSIYDGTEKQACCESCEFQSSPPSRSLYIDHAFLITRIELQLNMSVHIPQMAEYSCLFQGCTLAVQRLSVACQVFAAAVELCSHLSICLEDFLLFLQHLYSGLVKCTLELGAPLISSRELKPLMMMWRLGPLKLRRHWA